MVREREKQRERQTDRDRERERQRQRKRERQRERQREGEGDQQCRPVAYLAQSGQVGAGGEDDEAHCGRQLLQQPVRVVLLQHAHLQPAQDDGDGLLGGAHGYAGDDVGTRQALKDQQAAALGQPG